MKYIQHEKGKGAKQLFIADIQIPNLKSHQVLVKVIAFGVNRADILQRQGHYPAPPGESDILGLEISGEVVELGEDVANLKLGDLVFGLVAGGGYAEYAAVNSDHLMTVPNALNSIHCAGLAEVYLTAFQTLFWSGKIQRSQNVLIHAGASGVGLAAIQLAKTHDCFVAVTSSSDKKLELCQQLGANLAINYSKRDFVDEAKSKGILFDLVIDFIGGDYLNRNLTSLNTDGKIIYLAMLAGRYADPLDMALLLTKRAQIIGSTLRNRSDDYKAKLIREFANEYLKLFSSGQLQINIDSILNVSDISLAHEKLENNVTQGKVICTW